jgi:hypothetical protein
MAGIVGIFLEHMIEFRDRLARAVLAVEHDREIGARRGKTRRRIDRAAQQVLGILVAPDATGDFRQHADRTDVERICLKMALQERLGIGQPIVVQRDRGIDQRLGVVAVRERDSGHAGILNGKRQKETVREESAFPAEAETGRWIADRAMWVVISIFPT